MTPTRFKQIRQEVLKVTAVALAKSIGISRQSIAAYESGDKDIPVLVQKALMWELTGKPVE